jgi:hypothetical protein
MASSVENNGLAEPAYKAYSFREDHLRTEVPKEEMKNIIIIIIINIYSIFVDYNNMLACYNSLHTMHILATTLDMNNLSLLFDNKHQNPLCYIIFNHLTSEGIPWHMINPMRPKVTLNTQRSRIFSNIDMLLHQTTY